MKTEKNTLHATVTALLVASGIGLFTPAMAADGADTARGYVTDGFDRPVLDGVDNCVGDGTLSEGTAGKCSGAAAPTPVAEPKKEASSTGA